MAILKLWVDRFSLTVVQIHCHFSEISDESLDSSGIGAENQPIEINWFSPGHRATVEALFRESRFLYLRTQTAQYVSIDVDSRSCPVGGCSTKVR